MTTTTMTQSTNMRHYSLLGGMMLCYIALALVAFFNHEATTTGIILLVIGAILCMSWTVWQRVNPLEMTDDCLRNIRLAQAVVMLVSAAMFALFSFSHMRTFTSLSVFMMLTTLYSMLQLHTFRARTRASVQLEWLVVVSVSAFMVGFAVVRHIHYWSLKTLGFTVLMMIVIVMIFVLQQILNIRLSGKVYPFATTLLAAFFMTCHVAMTVCLALTYFSDIDLLWLVTSLFILSLIGLISLATWQVTLPYAGRAYLELLYAVALFMLGFNILMIYAHFSIWTVTCTIMSVVYTRFLLDEW